MASLGTKLAFIGALYMGAAGIGAKPEEYPQAQEALNAVVERFRAASEEIGEITQAVRKTQDRINALHQEPRNG